MAAGAGTRSFDPLPFLVGIVAVSVYALHGFQESLDRETSIFAYGGQQVLEGVPPYVSIFNVIGPLGHILAGAGGAIARLVGIDDLFGMRLLFLGFAALTPVILYLLARDLFGSRSTALAVAGTFLTFQVFTHYAVAGPREKTVMVLFAVTALLGAVRRRWALAGVAASLATLTWQPAAVIGVAVVLAALCRSEGRWRSLGKVLLGAFVPLAAIIGYFVVDGSLQAFSDGFLGFGFRVTGRPVDLMTRVRGIAITSYRGYGLSSWVFGAGIAGMVVFGVLRVLTAKTWGRIRDDPFLVVVVGFCLSLAWTLFDFQGTPDLFILLPFSALGVGALLYLAAKAVSPRAIQVVAITVAVLATGLAGFLSVTTRRNRLPLQQQAIENLLAQVPNGVDMVSLGAPQPLVMTGITNPNPYLIPFPAGVMHLEMRWPGGIAGFVDGLKADPPDVIAFRPTPDIDGPEAPLADLYLWIDQNYVRKGGAPGWSWRVHKSVASTE
jgi:hypothetical protein